MDIPRLYKVSALPTSPTAADDGVYFVRPNSSVGYICYIITNGVAVQQDAVTTTALTTLLGDYVKKDGSVAMTDALQIYKSIQSDFFSGNLQLKSNDVFNSISIGIGDSSIAFRTFIQAYTRQNNNPTDLLLNPAGGNVGVGVTSPQAKLHVNGNAIVADATASNHAVNLGQISGLTSNKANINGSNTTGGSWKIDYILSDVLQSAVGNSQVLYVQANGAIEYGSTYVVYHRFQCSSINGLKIGVDNVGTGEVWHQFNFDPSTKADVTYVNTQIATVSGSIPTNNNQLTNGAGYITISALVGYVTQTSLTTQLNDKVDKVAGKQLSTEDYTSAEKSKLNGIAAGAEVNVNADWNATSGDAQILNKPTIPTNNNQLSNGSGYQNASQVSATVTNQITNLGFAPKSHLYIPVTANNTVIDPSEHRRIVAVFTNPSVLVAVLPNNAFPGTVVTLQTTGTSVSVTMDYRRPGSSGSSLTMEPNRSLQMSFSEDQSAWIIEQYNILS